MFTVGASRPAFQSSKNVTEQKMLDCKLYDMSKQRFNYITQCQWQRKLFLEKQKKKTSIMRDLLRNVDVTVVNENPFSKNKSRRATVIPTNRTLPLALVQEKAATTLPGRRQTSDVIATPSLHGHSVFVTQRENFLPNINEDARSSKSNESRFIRAVDDANALPVVGANTTSLLTNQSHLNRWPMCDSRLTRLSASLSDSYPKYVPLRSLKSKVNYAVQAY